MVWLAVILFSASLAFCLFCLWHAILRRTRRRLMIPMALASLAIFYAASGGPAVVIGRTSHKLRPMIQMIYGPINSIGRTRIGLTPPWQLYRKYLDLWKDLLD